MANVAVIAKPFEHLFLDEDESEEFRTGYEGFAAEPFPSTFTTTARTDRVQSHWKQTDATRKMGNIGQDQLGMLSVRQHNLYVLAEGSQHKNGVDFYRVIDDSPIQPMPDKLVEYLLHLKAQRIEGKRHEKIDPSSSSASTVFDSPPVARIGDDVKEGGRNAALSRFAYHRWVLELCTPEQLRDEVHAMNDGFSQPLYRSEVDYLIDAKMQLRQIGTGVMFGGRLSPARAEEIEEDYESFHDQLHKLAAEGKTADEIAEALGIFKVNEAEVAPVTDDIIDREFPAYDGEAPKEPRMLIDGFLMGGINFFGSLSGVSKTWVALAVAKALTTGEDLFGVFPIKEKVPVLYLVPETDEQGFKYRLGLMKMPQDGSLFRYRTISQGKTLSLVDDLTLAAIKRLHGEGKYPHVLVIVDTAIRFMTSGGDEKSATDNTLSRDAEILRSPEVNADVLFLHHSPKASRKSDLTLETVLRGTGDFGAMADSVFGFRRDEMLFEYGDGPEEVEVINVKTRAPERPKPFRVRLKRAAKGDENDGRPVSVETGTLQYVGDDESDRALGRKLDQLLTENSAITSRALKQELGVRFERLKAVAATRGWRQLTKRVLDPKTGQASKQRLWSQLVTANDQEVDEQS
jgi:hypothetical protein